MKVAKVHLRQITIDNFQECIELEVAESQRDLIAPNVESLAEAKIDPNLFPLAIYDAAVRGYLKPQLPMVGFTMYEVVTGVGFILRLLVDRRHQDKGYGRAAIVEVIRRLRLHPEVELIATSHRRQNKAASNLYRSLGFVEWEIGWAKENELEVFLKLDEELYNSIQATHKE
jgi:diamine N-acetyltransferase